MKQALLATLSLLLLSTPASAAVRFQRIDGVRSTWRRRRRRSPPPRRISGASPRRATQVLGVRATHGRDLPKRLRTYAFAASLGGTRVLGATRELARRSGIPRRQLVLADRHLTYAHTTIRTRRGPTATSS